MPAGFTPFLANIGQISVGGGETAGFDQLIAAAPVAGGGAPQTAALQAAAPQIAAPLPVEGATPMAEAAPSEPAMAIEIPAVKPAIDKDNAAATLAATFLIALNGAVPDAAPVAGQPAPVEGGAETPADASAAEGTAPTSPVAPWIAIVAAATGADKPAKPAPTAGAPATDAPPAPPAAAKLRDALPAPMLAAAGTEPAAAKPVDAAPSMTILFTQPGAPGVAIFADAARQPAQLTERVLDIDSGGAWIDQLARDIAATKSDSGDIRFRLMPRHLGRLDVAMQMGDEGVSLKMDTQHEATASVVVAAQGRLVDDLRQQGVRVAGSEVTCTPGDTGRPSQGHGQSQGRTPGSDPAHLIETATERAEPRKKTEDPAADRRGRFA